MKLYQSLVLCFSRWTNLCPREAWSYVYTSSDSSEDRPPVNVKRNLLKQLELGFRRDYYRSYRQNLSEEKKKSIREKNRIRNKKYRAKQKVEPLTRKQRKKQQEKWRERKRNERSNPEKRKAYNELRRIAYQAKLPHVKISKEPKAFTETVKQMMEENVQLKYAMNMIMSVGSHRCEEDEQERSIERKILASLKATVNCLKDSINKKDRAKLGYIISSVSRSSSSRQVSSFFKLRRSTVEKYRQKAEYRRLKRKDALKSPFKRSVASFYEDQSYIMGGKRFIEELLLFTLLSFMTTFFSLLTSLSSFFLFSIFHFNKDVANSFSPSFYC